jgi:hypothetical protein
LQAQFKGTNVVLFSSIFVIVEIYYCDLFVNSNSLLVNTGDRYGTLVPVPGN